MIATLKSLPRTIGNTVIVVEHDEDTVRARRPRPWKMGPGPGVSRRPPWWCRGTLDDVAWRARSRRTGQFLSGKRSIRDSFRRRRREGATASHSWYAGRRRTTSRAWMSPSRSAGMVAVTGASGSGQEHADQRDPLQGAVEATGRQRARLPGEARRRGGHGVRPQGRQHRPVADPGPQQPVPTPATYVGLLRHDPRPSSPPAPAVGPNGGYKAGRFSFKREGAAGSEEMPGRGRHHPTQLYFHARRRSDLRRLARGRPPSHAETLEVTLRGKTIDDVLNMSVEEGVTFFACEPRRRQEDRSASPPTWGGGALGYLTLGPVRRPPSPAARAQARENPPTELSKLQRAKHTTVYILDEADPPALHLADVERLPRVPETVLVGPPGTRCS